MSIPLIFAIDPGPEKSGWVAFSDGQLGAGGHFDNGVVRLELEGIIRAAVIQRRPVILVQEMVACYGMAVGKTVFETCTWIGRFEQFFETGCSNKGVRGWHTQRITRPEIKVHLCNSMRAKDGNVKQALIDRLGPVGTKANPGPLYGVKSHVWSALAVAVTAADRLQ